MSTPRYAPAREDGRKPYMVAFQAWGVSYEMLGWGRTAADARYQVMGRTRVGVYHTKTRRATPADMEGR